MLYASEEVTGKFLKITFLRLTSAVHKSDQTLLNEQMC